MLAAHAFVIVNKASDWLSTYLYLQGAWFRSLLVNTLDFKTLWHNLEKFLIYHIFAAGG